MIGGHDIVLPTRGIGRSTALDVCLKITVRHWKQAVIQSGTTGEIYNGYGRVPFGKETELMVYRDRASLHSWETLGADEENRNTMVHLLAYTETQLTVVVDDLQATVMWRLLGDIRGAIRDMVDVRPIENEQAAA